SPLRGTARYSSSLACEGVPGCAVATPPGTKRRRPRPRAAAALRRRAREPQRLLLRVVIESGFERPAGRELRRRLWQRELHALAGEHIAHQARDEVRSLALGRLVRQP